MIIDKLENLQQYVSLNPLFPKVIEYIKSTDLSKLENGTHIIDGDDCFVNVMETKGKTKEEAVIETHKNMLDIQIPLNTEEIYGYIPTVQLPDAPYNAEKDCTKYPGVCSESFVTCEPGMMAIFWPQDGHQPCIGTAECIKKAVVKVRV